MHPRLHHRGREDGWSRNDHCWNICDIRYRVLGENAERHLLSLLVAHPRGCELCDGQHAQQKSESVDERPVLKYVQRRGPAATSSPQPALSACVLRIRSMKGGDDRVGLTASSSLAKEDCRDYEVQVNSGLSSTFVELVTCSSQLHAHLCELTGQHDLPFNERHSPMMSLTLEGVTTDDQTPRVKGCERALKPRPGFSLVGVL